MGVLEVWVGFLKEECKIYKYISIDGEEKNILYRFFRMSRVENMVSFFPDF